MSSNNQSKDGDFSTFFFARSPEAPKTIDPVSNGTDSPRMRHLPITIVLSLSSSWDVSIEGMVPDIERWRVMLDEEMEEEDKRQ